MIREHRGETPETDGKASSIIGFFSCATVPADFARKLERERDEALKIIREASVKFCCDGPDGQIAAEMFRILEKLPPSSVPSVSSVVNP